MIHSMAGYGKFVVTFNEKKINIELKSLNSKLLDLSTRIAPIYREKEMEIRQMISQSLIRGKIDFSIWVEKDDTSVATPINSALVETDYKQLKDLSQSIGIPEPQDWFATLMRMPDVLTKSDVEELSEEEWAIGSEGIKNALLEIVRFRQQEGEALYTKFCEKLDNISSLLVSIESYEKQRVDKIRARIVDNLNNLVGVDYDNNRLEQELIYYIEKLDIRETMTEGVGQGKKLGFIAQEMGREINTTGSKSNHAEMQNLVVMMKDELEQIKEQVLNVL